MQFGKTIRTFQQFLQNNSGEVWAMIGTLSTPVANLLAGVIAVKNLTPLETGTIGVAALLPIYLVFLHGGILTGMSRELPIALGAKNEGEANKILSVTELIAWIVGVLSAAICVISGLYFWWKSQETLILISYIAAGFSALSQPIVLQSDIALRSLGQYKRFGLNYITTNTLAFLSTPIISVFGSTGAIVRGIAISVFGILIRKRTLRFPVWNSTNRVEAWKLAKVGFPLLISGTLFGILTASDRSVVAFVFGRESVGLYAMASIVVNSLQAIPQSISLIMFPKIARHYGQSKKQSSLRPYVWKTLAFNMVLLLPIGIIGRLAIKPIVTLYFPRYIPGIPAAEWACLTSVFWMYLGVGSVFGVLNKMTLYLSVLGGSVALVWIVGFILAHSGLGLLGPAIARLFATAIICLFTIFYAFYLTSSKRNI